MTTRVDLKNFSNFESRTFPKLKNARQSLCKENNTKGNEMIETKKQIQIVDWKTAVKVAKDFSNVKEEPNILFSISEEIEAWDQNFLMKLTRR